MDAASDVDEPGRWCRTTDLHACVGNRLGAYELLEPLGAGGMCAVYRARHVELGIEVAVKILHPSHARQQVSAQRIRREAAAGLRLDHPNVVRVLELGIGQRGPYLVMELLRGRTLLEVIDRGAPICTREAARIVRQTAAGLAAAHRAGFVHRDLKPANLMLVPGPEGELLKILDLGIAGVTSPAPNEHLTRDDLILGTPAYMAPEQFQRGVAGPEADLYALGVVLYQMIAGRLPFQGKIQEIIVQQVMATPPPLPDADGLEELAYWLLDKVPAKRPRSAEAVIAFIDRRFSGLAPALPAPAGTAGEGGDGAVGADGGAPAPPSIGLVSRDTTIARRQRGFRRTPIVSSTARPPTALRRRGTRVHQRLEVGRRSRWRRRAVLSPIAAVLVALAAYAAQQDLGLLPAPRATAAVGTLFAAGPGARELGHPAAAAAVPLTGRAAVQVTSVAPRRGPAIAPRPARSPRTPRARSATAPRAR